jgi:hypothetical protein
MNDPKKKRSQLLHKIANASPFLRGSITSVCAKCSRAKCVCTDGPSRLAYRLTYKDACQKTKTVYIPQQELGKARQLIANYRRFRELAEQLVEANVEVFKQESHRRQA